ncbi:MAG: class I SAM-dependent methyltransferase [Flectobacillus sp.]|nr:class I SAM-dependent methyltransferase [Flectobacillus sp.]
MIKSSFEEYKIMFEVEKDLWWYRILHEKIYEALQERFSNHRDVKLLDIGCGTGGLLDFLREKGYTNLQGIDYSEAAIHFAQSRDLRVTYLSIDNVAEHFEGQQFDAIICDDVFYCLETEQIELAFVSIASLLKSGGLFLSNNNAFASFYGTHDVAVGGKHRFVLADFKPMIQKSKLSLVQHSYWSLFLAPLIWAVRFSQRIQLKCGFLDESNLTSDVEMPAIWLNNCFYRLVKMEERLIKTGFWGSSLFLKIKKA